MGSLVSRGRAWRFGTDVDTDAIVPSQYLRYDPAEYCQHVMEPLAPEFAAEVATGDVIVAERNFGIGSSREHAAIGLKEAGIGAVVAESFGRIFYRNSINQGLPVAHADGEVVTSIADGDRVTVDISTGHLTNETTTERYAIEPPDGLAAEILGAGGVEAYYASDR